MHANMWLFSDSELCIEAGKGGAWWEEGLRCLHRQTHFPDWAVPTQIQTVESDGQSACMNSVSEFKLFTICIKKKNESIDFITLVLILHLVSVLSMLWSIRQPIGKQMAKHIWRRKRWSNQKKSLKRACPHHTMWIRFCGKFLCYWDLKHVLSLCFFLFPHSTRSCEQQFCLWTIWWFNLQSNPWCWVPSKEGFTLRYNPTVELIQQSHSLRADTFLIIHGHWFMWRTRGSVKYVEALDENTIKKANFTESSSRTTIPFPRTRYRA